MELPEDPRVREAVVIAMKSLVRRSRLSGEISKSLQSKGYLNEEIEATLRFLSGNGLIDDEKAIAEQVESRSGRRSVGSERLRSELLSKGATASQVEEALASRIDEDELAAMLAALAGRRWNPLERDRAGRFLASRGFDPELIPAALDRSFGPEAD